MKKTHFFLNPLYIQKLEFNFLNSQGLCHIMGLTFGIRVTSLSCHSLNKRICFDNSRYKTALNTLASRSDLYEKRYERSRYESGWRRTY